MAAATGPVTSRVDVSTVVEHKLAALREHVTQIASDSFFLIFSADEWRRFAPTEDFTLRASGVGVRIPEADLFTGLEPENGRVA